MAPNLSSKSSFTRTDFDSFKKDYDVETINKVRTDFIVQNIYSFLISPGFSFETIPAVNDEETRTLIVLKELTTSFRENYKEAIENLCLQVIDFSYNVLGSTLEGVANELFCEGVSWYKIVGLFVFIGELTLKSLSKGYSALIVDVMYECFVRLVKENLSEWIKAHGGWEGVEAEREPPRKSLAKSILHCTVKMLGTFAHIANTSTGQLS